MASLVGLPDDIKLEILKHLDFQDACSLSIVHSSWTLPSRMVIFERIEANYRTNDNLSDLAHAMPPAFGDLIRHLGLSFSWHLNTGQISTAAQMVDWLRERDNHFSGILEKASHLRTLRICFQFGSPYVGPTIQDELNRGNLKRTAVALCKRHNLQTLQLNFRMRSGPHTLHSALLPAIAFVDTLAQSGTLRQLTSVSLVEITVASIHQAQPDDLDALTTFSKFIGSLPALRHLQLDNFFVPPACLPHILPLEVESFELLDNFRHYSAMEVLQVLVGKPNLRHFRFVAYGRGSSISDEDTSVSFRGPETPFCVVHLETLHLGCPGTFQEEWLIDLVTLIERGQLQFPYLRTLCLDVKLWCVPNDSDAKALALALSTKASFPASKVVQIPDDWSNSVHKYIAWATDLKRRLEGRGIDLQFVEGSPSYFERFTRMSYSSK